MLLYIIFPNPGGQGIFSEIPRGALERAILQLRISWAVGHRGGGFFVTGYGISRLSPFSRGIHASSQAFGPQAAVQDLHIAPYKLDDAHTRILLAAME